MQITRAQARTRREYLESRPPPRRGLGHQYKGVGGSASVEGDHGGSNNLQRGSRRRLQKRQPLELFPDRFAYGKVNFVFAAVGMVVVPVWQWFFFYFCLWTVSVEGRS
jgi:hypothetical protein